MSTFSRAFVLKTEEAGIVRSQINRKTWLLPIGGLVALAMLARQGGARRRRVHRVDREATDVA